MKTTGLIHPRNRQTLLELAGLLPIGHVNVHFLSHYVYFSQNSGVGTLQLIDDYKQLEDNRHSHREIC